MRIAILPLVLALTACHGGFPRETQFVGLDSDLALAVMVNGVEPHLIDPPHMETPKAGAPVQRVITGADGARLFAYDLTVMRTGGGSYRLQLAPASAGPTFQRSREIVLGQGSAGATVELMENPATGAKIVDEFHVVRRVAMDAGERLDLTSAVHAHLRQLAKLFH